MSLDLDGWVAKLAANRNAPSREVRKLYAVATSSISLDKFKADRRLLDIWLQHLELERKAGGSYDELRDKYKYLKSRVGSTSASLFIHWARFEQSCGHMDQAKSILMSGIDVSAQPLDALKDELNVLDSPKNDIAPPQAPLSEPAKSTVEPPPTPQAALSTSVVPTPQSASATSAASLASKEKMKRLLASLNRSMNNRERPACVSVPESPVPIPSDSVSQSTPMHGATSTHIEVPVQKERAHNTSKVESPTVPLVVEKSSPKLTEPDSASKSEQPRQAAPKAEPSNDSHPRPIPTHQPFEHPPLPRTLPTSAAELPPVPASQSKIQSISSKFRNTGQPAPLDIPKSVEEESTPLAPEGKQPKQPGSFEYLTPIKSEDEEADSPVPQRAGRASDAIPSKPPALESNHKGLYITVNRVPYKRIELIGRGASSKVYKVISESGKILALKKVKLDRQDPLAIEGYLNEIQLLKKLVNSDAIITLVDSEICADRKSLLLLLEYGEIDLAHLLLKDKSLIGNLNFIRLQWTQMLQAVQQIHNEKIVHSDLKPANFLIVEGKLKLIDFGIAKSIPSDTTNIQRDYQTGTLNYMAPEAIMFTESNSKGQHLKLGRASDIWSLGCILYQLVYGQPPFAALPIVQKLNAIVDSNFHIAFGEVSDSSLLQVMKSCLNRDPKARMTIPELLAHPFLHPQTAGEGTVLVSKMDLLKVLKAGIELGRRTGDRGDVGKDTLDAYVESIYAELVRRK